MVIDIDQEVDSPSSVFIVGEGDGWQGDSDGEKEITREG
jgi:hypothetical protein